MSASSAPWQLFSRSRGGKVLQLPALKDVLIQEKLNILRHSKRSALALNGLSPSALVLSADLSSHPATVGVLSLSSSDIIAHTFPNPFLSDHSVAQLQTVLREALETALRHASTRQAQCESKQDGPISVAVILPDSLAPSESLPGSADTVKATIRDLLEAQLADLGSSVGVTRVLTQAQALHEQFEQETLAKWDAAYRPHAVESEIALTRACLLVASFSSEANSLPTPSDYLVLSIGVSIDSSVGTVMFPRLFTNWPSVASVTFTRSSHAAPSDQVVMLYLFEGEQLYAQSPANRIHWQAQATPSPSATALILTASLGPQGQLKLKVEQTVDSQTSALVDWTEVGVRLSTEEIDQMLSAAHQIPAGPEFNPKLAADDINTLSKHLDELLA